MIIKAIAPDSPEELKQRTQKGSRDYILDSEDLHSLLGLMTEFYYNAESRSDRINAISLFTRRFSFSRLRAYIPDLSHHLYYRAKRLARQISRFVKESPSSKPRYYKPAIREFIRFITRYHCKII